MKKLAVVTLLLVTGCGRGPAEPAKTAEQPPPDDPYLVESDVDFKDGLPARTEDGSVNVVVEIPAGTNDKWEVEDDGTLRWEFRDGKRQNTKTKASLFETYRYDKSDLSSNQEFQTDGFQMREVVRAKVTDLKKTFGRKRDYKISSIITSHGNVKLKIGREKNGPEPQEEKAVPDLAVSIATTIGSRFASESDVRQLSENVENILGLPDRPEIFDELGRKEFEDKTRFVMLLRLSFGWPQIIRLRSASENQIWMELASLMLGPE